MLVKAEPRQVIIKHLGIRLVGKIAVGDPPVSDRPRHPVDQLAHGILAPSLERVCAMRNIPVEILGNGDFRGERRPGFGHFHIILLKDHLAVVVGDGSIPAVPLDLVEWGDIGITKSAFKF